MIRMIDTNHWNLIKPTSDVAYRTSRAARINWNHERSRVNQAIGAKSMQPLTHGVLALFEDYCANVRS